MDFYIILGIFLLSLSINLIFFIVAFIFKINILIDIIYCLSFISLSVTIVSGKQNFSPVQICLFILYNTGALRLGSYLLIKIIKNKVDYHFTKINNNFGKLSLFGFWQGILVFMISIPTLFALSVDIKYFNNIFSDYLLIFILFAILFLVIEIIADGQKFNFSLKKKNSLFFMNYGLGKDCRHPNYLGEIGFGYMIAALFICYLFLKNISNNINYLLHILGLLSSLSLNIVLIKISGVPRSEIKQGGKGHNNDDYQQYLSKTSCVMCYIGKKGLINKFKKLMNDSRIGAKLT